MPANVIKSIGKSTTKLAYKSAFYHWSLSGDVPDSIAVKPIDPWPGNADAALFLCSGSLVIDEQQANLHGGIHALKNIESDGWIPKNLPAPWIEYMHGFTWLRDLKALGGDTARRTARALIADWIRHNARWNEATWNASVTGERVALWIALYDFFGESADEAFQNQFFEALVCQARHLARTLPGENHGIEILRSIKGLLYAGLAFEGHETWVEQSLDLLKTEMDRQILSDGAHVSRSPQQLLAALQILLDVRGALAVAKYPLPEKIQHKIDAMVPALKFLRGMDKGFVLFNGTQEGSEALVDCVLAQVKSTGKGLQHLPAAGYERLSLGRTHITVDVGKTPEWPYDRHAHAAPLAFEMSYGRERMFVSCGTHPFSPEWQEALRATAAHNTATLNNRNACEIREDGFFTRKVKTVSVHRETCKTAALLEASHDGYTSLNGVTHRRRIYLSDGGNDIRGEDMFSSGLAPQKPIDVAIRFHLYPTVQVSIVREGTEAILRLGSTTGWRFFHAGGVLALENSIYLGEGARPRKTKQLVLYGQINEPSAQIRWGIKRT